MSQNKTIIQGLEPETNFGGAPNGASSISILAVINLLRPVEQLCQE